MCYLKYLEISLAPQRERYTDKNLNKIRECMKKLQNI